MASRKQRRIAILKKKLHALHSLTSTKSMKAKRSARVIEAFLCIYNLKLKLEAINKEYLNLMAIKRECQNLVKNLHLPKEVKVEKKGEELTVKVKCEKKEDMLVSILEAFEELGINVLEARVSCENIFSMEAIAMAQDKALNVEIVINAINLAIENPVSKGPIET